MQTNAKKRLFPLKKNWQPDQFTRMLDAGLHHAEGPDTLNKQKGWINEI